MKSIIFHGQDQVLLLIYIELLLQKMVIKYYLRIL
nr:MAG TPA: hypothetical protein [Bacteriophage sp.]